MGLRVEYARFAYHFLKGDAGPHLDTLLDKVYDKSINPKEIKKDPLLKQLQLSPAQKDVFLAYYLRYGSSAMLYVAESPLKTPDMQETARVTQDVPFIGKLFEQMY